MSPVENANAVREAKAQSTMTFLSEIAASIIKARPGMKGKFEALPERRQRYVLGHGLAHFAHLIEVQYEEHCQRTRMGRKRT